MANEQPASDRPSPTRLTGAERARPEFEQAERWLTRDPALLNAMAAQGKTPTLGIGGTEVLQLPVDLPGRG